MISRLIILFSFCIALASCSKSTDNKCNYAESTIVAPASETASVEAYINIHNPAAIPHPSGFYYEILSAGAGTVTPAVCSNVTVKYVGYLSNGYKFDENTTGVTFPLGGLIIGWQKGIPLIKAGGSINLFIQPSLGYGNNAVGSIPANSMLIFNVQLLDVQ